jgi:hypothetical protein
MKWEAEDGNYTYTIEGEGEMFDLTVNFLGQKDCLWFRSYAAARKFVREEHCFKGRFKKVEE